MSTNCRDAHKHLSRTASAPPLNVRVHSVMTANRRDVIKGSLALAVRSALFSSGIGVAASLASCGGDGSDSDQGPPPALAIQGLSNSSPMALTPVTISTAGLDATQPFTVNLSIGGAAASALTPIRTDSDGTIHVALPLNADSTGTTTVGYSAALTVTQGAQTTQAATLAVQDIPSLASYGTNLGAISHAFLNYLSLTQARVVNELQAIAINYPSVDTSANQTTLTGFSLSALHARNDVDRVTNDTALQIPAGVDPTAGEFYFTQSSVELQDRLYGFYLTQLEGPVNAAPGAVAAFARHQRRASHTHGAMEKSGTSSQLNLLTTVLGATLTGSLGVSAAIASAVSPDANTASTTAALDSVSGLLFGATKYLAVAGLVTGGSTDALAAVTGVLGATCACASDLIKYYNSQDQIIALQAAGGSQAALTAATNQANSALVSAATDVIGGVLSALPAIPAVNDILASNLAANVGYQGSALVTSIASLSADAIGQQITAAQAAGDQLNTVAPSTSQGFADLTGICSINNSNAGTDLTALYEANLNIPGSSGATQLNSITDASGNYDVLVPLSNATLSYATASLDIQDPSTGTVLTTEAIDLLNLTDAGATAPPVSGSCTDTDANSPDGDDPDCD